MKPIRVYTTRWCGHCVRAKALLRSRGLAFEEISLDDEPAFREKLLREPLDAAHTAGLTERAARDALGVVTASYEYHGGFRLRTLSA